MESPFKVKVCGITRKIDAKNAVALGADMLGLIFYRRSPRWVSLTTASEILRSIPPTVVRVGIFVNESPSIMIMRARKLRLNYVQLSGSESNLVVRKLKKEGLTVIKSFNPNDRADLLKMIKTEADIILLDNRTAKLPGGTGERFDWNARLPKKFNNLMLSGGINGENIREGVKKFKPLIVDVNSSVETKPGIKSKKKLAEFFKACNRIRYGR